MNDPRELKLPPLKWQSSKDPSGTPAVTIQLRRPAGYAPCETTARHFSESEWEKLVRIRAAFGTPQPRTRFPHTGDEAFIEGVSGTWIVSGMS
jgi:hypothetical protein